MTYKLSIKISDDPLSNTQKYYKKWLDADGRQRDTPPNLEGDAGMDLYFPTQQIVQSQETVLVPFGISAEMTHHVGLHLSKPKSYFIVPRSSIYKTPLRMANSIGVIDSGYRGELMVPVDNPTDDDYMITPGERLFQIILPNLEEFEVEIVDYLSDSVRGEGGFGSTGK